MSLFFDYRRSGTGVSKEANKKPIIVFGGILFRKIWNLFVLNSLYMIFCIPVITIGPATAGITKILKNYIQDKPSFMFSDFWDSFKSNFKYSFITGIINIIEFIVFFISITMYYNYVKNNGGVLGYSLFGTTIGFAVILTLMNFYIYLMIVSTDISLKNIFKNAFALAFIEFKKNILLLLLVVGIIIGFAILLNFYPILVLILPFVPLSIIGLIICFVCYPVIRKYVIDPYYEQRGEKNPENEDYDEEAVFKDMGGKEAPIDNRKKKTKRKTIS